MTSSPLPTTLDFRDAIDGWPPQTSQIQQGVGTKVKHYDEPIYKSDTLGEITYQDHRPNSEYGTQNNRHDELMNKFDKQGQVLEYGDQEPYPKRRKQKKLESFYDPDHQNSHDINIMPCQYECDDQDNNIRIEKGPNHIQANTQNSYKEPNYLQSKIPSDCHEQTLAYNSKTVDQRLQQDIRQNYKLPPTLQNIDIEHSNRNNIRAEEETEADAMLEYENQYDSSIENNIIRKCHKNEKSKNRTKVWEYKRDCYDIKETPSGFGQSFDLDNFRKDVDFLASFQSALSDTLKSLELEVVSGVNYNYRNSCWSEGGRPEVENTDPGSKSKNQNNIGRSNAVRGRSRRKGNTNENNNDVVMGTDCAKSFKAFRFLQRKEGSVLLLFLSLTIVHVIIHLTCF